MSFIVDIDERNLELTYVFPDGDRIYVVRFVVNDSSAAYGVLKVVFIDIQSQASP